MKLSNRMINHLNKFGEYDTKKYHYFISSHNGKEYVKRYPTWNYGYGTVAIGKTENIKVWKGTSWMIF